MKEQFIPTPSQEKGLENPSIVSMARDRFMETTQKCKEFLLSKGYDLKVGATVLLSLGVFEMAQGQTTDVLPHVEKAVDNVASGKIKVADATNAFYVAFKEKYKDSTFSMVEMHGGKENNTYINDSNKITRSELVASSLNDTVRLGTVQARKISIMMHHEADTANNEIKKDTYVEDFRFLNAIKTNIEGEDTTGEVKEYNVHDYGKTPEEAVISAVASASGMKSTHITVMHRMNTEEIQKRTANELIDNFNQEFTSLSVHESDNTLYNVRVVVKKVEKGPFNGYYQAVVLYK
jgi:uncharacterized OsmC-like protein